MAQLVVRNLEADVKVKLRRRAERHGRSMEAEVREILRSAVLEEAVSGEPLGTRIARRFAGIGFLEEELPKRVGSAPRPVRFEE